MTDAVLKQVTPVIPLSDVTAAACSFCDVLGFAALWRDESDAYIRTDDVARQISCQIDVTALDALCDRMRPPLNRSPGICPGAHFDRDHGQRELHVTYGPWPICFGEGISSGQPI